MSLEVRRARVGEAELLQRICLDADEAYVEVGRPDLAGEPFPIDTLARSIERGRVLVAVDPEDVPVGWVLVAHEGPEPCVGQIAVERRSARRGIGRQLLDAALVEVAAAGHPTVILNTERAIAWNEPWYRRVGFVVVAEPDWTPDMHEITREQIDDGLDWGRRVHMRLTL